MAGKVPAACRYMKRTLTIQEFVHWLEVGGGARWVRISAMLAGTFLLSWLVAVKQFHGPLTESTLVQADMGRQLARGAGFTTRVNYPQTAAFLEARGRQFDAGRPYPELYHAPLYSLAIAGTLRLFPASSRARLFGPPPPPPDGFAADYILLQFNIVCLWATLLVTFVLARRLFDIRTAWLSALALLLSVSVWQQTVAVNGTALLLLLAVTVFAIWERVEASIAAGVFPATWLGGLGVACGLLFLAEYTAGAVVVIALLYNVARRRGRKRLLAATLVAAGFLLAAGPYMIRNVALTGSPVGLAVQNIALKAGDPTAEPAVVLATWSAELPAIDLNKLGNKTLTALQDAGKNRLWSGGALWLLAFFVAGLLYTFRSTSVNRLRWVFVVVLGAELVCQAACGSGENERAAVVWLAPLMIIFGAGFFFVLVGSNPWLGRVPRWSAAALLVLQALPLLHDALEPRRLHFQYPPYFPALLQGMRFELERRGVNSGYGVMADVPAGLAWYGDVRAWAQPPRLHDFYTIEVQQSLAELLLTPHTLDRPFFSELNARPVLPGSLRAMPNRFGEWGEIYAGLLTGNLPREFPLRAPQKLADNLYVLLNPALVPIEGI